MQLASTWKQSILNSDMELNNAYPLIVKHLLEFVLNISGRDGTFKQFERRLVPNDFKNFKL